MFVHFIINIFGGNPLLDSFLDWLTMSLDDYEPGFIRAPPDEVSGGPIVITLSVRLSFRQSVHPLSFHVRSVTQKPYEIFSRNLL